MKGFRTVFAVACICLFAVPASAALKVGAIAPNFTGTGSLGGKIFKFNLASALRKGPVVLYFFPSAYTQGCDLEAHTFATQIGKFKAVGASVVGVSADDLARLKQFSADPHFCAGKFPIVSDASTRIAASYKLHVSPAIPGAKDVRGVKIGHGFIERFTYVIGRGGKILAEFSSRLDHLTPDQHVYKSLAIVRQLQSSRGKHA